MTKRFPFSNFQRCLVTLDGVTYDGVEWAYQAAKSLDPAEREWIRSSETAGTAKRRGQLVHMRSDWPDIKDIVMLFLLRQKFASGSEHAKKLVAFTDEIVELNDWHDNYFGYCTCSQCVDIPHGNRLGQLLTQVRDELMGER